MFKYINNNDYHPIDASLANACVFNLAIIFIKHCLTLK